MECSPATTVIIAGGSQPDLFECLLSVAELDYRPRSTLVVDNSAQGLRAALATAFPRALVVRPGRRLTFAAAANLGMRQAIAGGAGLLFLLNDDVTVHSDTLSILARAEAEGGPGVYAPEIWPYESGAPRTRFRIDWAKRLTVREHVGDGASRGLDYAEGSAMLVSAQAFLRLGGFDEGFGFYYEDVDFSVRARDEGFAVREISGARVWHKGSVSAGPGLSPFKAYWRARNTMKFAAKHRSRAHLAANAFYHFGGFVGPETAKAALGTLAGRRRDAEVLAAICRGTWDLFTGGGHDVSGKISADGDAGARLVPLLREIL